MAVLNVQMGSVGLAGVQPRVVYIDTNDTLAAVTTAGYLNKLVQQGYKFSESDMCCVSTRATPSSLVIAVAWLEVSYVAPNWSLVPTGSPGQVVLPTVANRLVHATNATGTLSTDAANVTNAGNISAGLSGTAGYLESFSATLNRGSLRLVATANTGNTVTQITNAAQAAARIYTIPDGGQAASSFLLTDSAGTQTIATGSLALTLGSLTVAAGNIAATLGSVTAGTTVTAGTGITATAGNITATAGNIVATAGSIDATVGAVTAGTTVTAGTGITSTTGNVAALAGNFVAGSVAPAAGNFQSFPSASGGANDKFVFAGVTNGGNFTVTLSNAAMGQSTTVSIADPGAATGYINTSTVNASTTPVGAFFTKTINLGFAALAAGGLVVIQTSAGSQQYKVRDVKVNYGAAGLSGGGGDRLIQITDGTTVYNNAGITAALLGTPINTAWGGTGNPLPGTVSADTATVAGQNLRALYAGGTTDYTAGSVDITVALERVA